MTLLSGLASIGKNCSMAALAVILLQSPAWAEEARPLHWADAVSLPESENLYQVSKDLYRAAQPSSEAFRAYEKMGIRTIVNLRALHSDGDKIGDGRLQLIEIPINTWNISDEEVIAALRAIRFAPKPVLVHCQHGADRTGTVVAMYRIIFEGWPREKALEELENGGFGFHRIWINIPRYIQSADIEKIRQAVFSP